MINERKYRNYPEAFKLEALAVLKKKEKSAGWIKRELGITPTRTMLYAHTAPWGMTLEICDLLKLVKFRKKFQLTQSHCLC